MGLSRDVRDTRDARDTRQGTCSIIHPKGFGRVLRVLGKAHTIS